MGPYLFPVLMLLVIVVGAAGGDFFRLALVRRKLRTMGFTTVRQDRNWRIVPTAGRVAIGAFVSVGSGNTPEATIYVTEEASYPYRLQVSTGVDGYVKEIAGRETLAQRALAWTRQNIAIPVFFYLFAYALSASFGGYNPYYNSDGRHAWPGDFPAHTAIIWEPGIGSYLNRSNNDFFGCLFFPVLMLDRHFLHKTHYVFEPGFGAWWESLSDGDIHPSYREKFHEWRAKERTDLRQEARDRAAPRD